MTIEKPYVACYSAPLSETTVPIEDEKYKFYSKKELQAWLNQCRRTWPDDQFEIKELQPFKTWTVVIVYEDNEWEREHAFNVCDNLPYCWDDKAREELGREYFDYIRRLKCPQDYPSITNTKEDTKQLIK